jgi:hypothetical protein
VSIKTFFMLQEQSEEQSLFDLALSAHGNKQLQLAASWAKGIAILGLVLAVGFSIRLISLIYLLNDHGEFVATVSNFNAVSFMIMLVILATIVLSFLQLLQFARLVKEYAKSNEAIQLSQAFRALKICIVIWLLLFSYNLFLTIKELSLLSPAFFQL